MILIYKFAIIDLYFGQIGQSLPTTTIVQCVFAKFIFGQGKLNTKRHSIKCRMYHK